MTSPVNGLGLFEIVKRMGEGRSLSWDRPLKKGEGVDRLRGTELPVYALSNRPMHGEGEMGGRSSPQCMAHRLVPRLAF